MGLHLFRRQRPETISIGPSADDIAKAVGSWFQTNVVTPWKSSVVAPIAAFPQTIEKAVLDVGKETASLWSETRAAVESAEEAVEQAVDSIELVSRAYADWHVAREAQARQDLTAFLDDLVKTLDELPRILAEIKLNLDQSLHPQIAAIVSSTPGIIMFAIDRALSARPGWEQEPATLLALLKLLPSLDNDLVCKVVLDEKAVDVRDVRRARTTAVLLLKALEAAKDVAPRDLSITAVAVAGGGTEIAGHPIRWPLLFAEQILGLIDQTLARYLETYESCAQDQWQRDVTDRLNRIEQRLIGH